MPRPGPRHRMRGIPDDLEFQQNLYTIVGHLVVGFGQLDFGIDMLVGLLFRDFGGASKHWKKLPVPFESRMEFIADCAENLAAVAPYRVGLLRIVDQAPSVAATRNDVAHGYVGSYRRSDHLLTYVKAAFDKQNRSFQIVKIRDITARQLLRVGAQAVDLAAHTTRLNMRMADALIRAEKKRAVTTGRRGG